VQAALSRSIPASGQKQGRKSKGCCRQELLSIRDLLVKEAPAGD
jgi:hypothetical protein